MTVLSSVKSSFKDFDGNFLTEVFLLLCMGLVVGAPVQSGHLPFVSDLISLLVL